MSISKYSIAPLFFQNDAKFGFFEMCFAIGSQHLWCRGYASRIQCIRGFTTFHFFSRWGVELEISKLKSVRNWTPDPLGFPDL